MKVKYMIETSWSHDTHSGEIEFDSADVEADSITERDNLIENIVGEAVANEVSWGWEITDA